MDFSKLKHKGLKHTSSLFAAIGMISVVAVPSVAIAATWPDKAVRMVVGYAPGGSTDVLARVVAKSMSDATGQPFVVENRPGANSNMAAESVARSAPDGYTIFMGTISTATNVSVYKEARYNIDSDLISVAPLAAVPNLLVVNAKLPIYSVQEYVKYATQNPGKLTFASPGVGSSVHLSGELFKLKTGIDMLHVPYRGSGPALNDLLGGQVDSMFDNLPSVLPHVQSGALRALGVTTQTRNASLPSVAPISEQGVADYDAYAWFGFFLPAGTSPGIVDSLNQLVRGALNDPSTTKQLASMGASPMNMTPGEYQEFVHKEIAKWAEVIKTLDIKKN